MKDATVSARVEYDVKTEAEAILQKLGIPVSVVIDSLYRQIIFMRGVPFSLTLPPMPKTLDMMTEEEFHEEMRRGLEQARRGEGIPLDEAFAKLERGLV